MLKLYPKRFCMMLMRKKFIPGKGLGDCGSVNRTLTVFDLCMYGVGAMCGGYIYGVSIVLVATKSGASSFISNIIAGLVAGLNAQCYAELSSRLPFGGGGYNFTYMICGELLALVIGWAMLLEYLLGFAFASVGAANAINVLSNHTLNDLIISYLGRFPNTNGYITDTPNVLAGLICVAIIILLGFGAKISLSVNAAITAFSTTILLICALFMAFQSKIKEFSILQPFNGSISNNKRSNWMPFGISGIIGGAGLTFNAFSGFDGISLTGDAVIDPRQSVPLSINICVILVFLITTFYYICLSLYLPWFMVNPKLGLSGLFYDQKVLPMQIIGGIGEITGYVTSGLANMFALSQIILSLSKDGLICPFFQYISTIFHVPIFTNLVCGVVTVLMALLFDMNILANFMSAGTLLSYTIVAIDLLILRLINLEKIEINLPEDKIGMKFSIKEISFIPCVERLCNSPLKTMKPLCFIIFLLILLMSCLIASYASILPSVNLSVRISVLSISLLILCLSCIFLFLFKYYIPEEGFKVSSVPFVPIICVISNIILSSNLQFKVWCQLGVWLLLGLVCYVFYGMWHSHINFDDESTILIHKGSTETLALSMD